MRLVSALYDDFYPFHVLDMWDSFIVTKEPKDLLPGDVLIVWGGADISPALYNKGRSSKSYAESTPSRRDTLEWELMKQAKSLGIPIIGVCRGAQMLCALEGGYLIQHVDNHGGEHEVFLGNDKNIKTNSIHHQMMMPLGDFDIVGWTEMKSNRYFDEDIVLTQHPLGCDPEFVFYPKSKGFAIQWHPEMMSLGSSANQMVLNFIKQHV